MSDEPTYTAEQWERAYNRQGAEVSRLQEEVDRLEARGEADRIDELNRWVARIGDANTISEMLSNELRARIAELQGAPSDGSGSAGVVPQ